MAAVKLKAHAFTLRQLQYLVALADTLNLGHAAALCRVQQPSLRAQVEQLEDALGVQVFERGKRNQVTVTPAGEELVLRARRLLALADDLGQAARRVGDPLSGVLRLGVVPALTTTALPRVAATLRERFPRLTALWIEHEADALLRGLGLGELDAALLAHAPDARDLEHEVVAGLTLAWALRSPIVRALRELARALDDAAP